MEKKLLSEQQMTEAVVLFAQGQTRPQIAQHFIDTDIDINKLQETEPKLRKHLSNALQTADPSSPRFAESKYRETYELHREAVRNTLKHKYDSVMKKAIETLEQQITDMKTEEQALKDLVSTGKDLYVEGVGDYTASNRTLDAKRKEIQDAELKLAERIAKATEPAHSTENA